MKWAAVFLSLAVSGCYTVYDAIYDTTGIVGVGDDTFQISMLAGTDDDRFKPEHEARRQEIIQTKFKLLGVCQKGYDVLAKEFILTNDGPLVSSYSVAYKVKCRTA